MFKRGDKIKLKTDLWGYVAGTTLTFDNYYNQRLHGTQWLQVKEMLKQYPQHNTLSSLFELVRHKRNLPEWF